MNIATDLPKAEQLLMKKCLRSNFNHVNVKSICNMIFVKNAFHNYYTILQNDLTIPASCAACERSFSSILRQKNCLRTCMEHQIFTNVIILSKKKKKQYIVHK